ncbi:hypothetical protein A4S05_11470 [Nostoc sp. KVJ20]|uniref:hypothetical protein n=1 Tax=Nostoc sp. KVJ20 TaxID=457944 RepID=UPI00083DD86D|nr:hypothetical protein [Nostoc sp. KVJ20]ODG97897.1 hypothetical protein A4S05_11470 [Nostoc sp. KVJ20]
MSNNITVQHDKLIAKCVEVASTALSENEVILEIRRAQPDFGRNYTVVYKVYLATLDASGINPTNKRCVVVGIPISDIESGSLQPDRSCDLVQDL